MSVLRFLFIVDELFISSHPHFQAFSTKEKEEG